MESKLLYILTRTPLHVGAGVGVGAIDQPIVRERHTGFPIIPASSLKGSFCDLWPATKTDRKGVTSRISTQRIEEKSETSLKEADDAAWLFGSDSSDLSFAGALLFFEARLIAFPIRSAKGSFAWITCPLILQRASRDGVIKSPSVDDFPNDELALFSLKGPIALAGDQVVLEDYCFKNGGAFPQDLAQELSDLLDDGLWQQIKDRLVIVSNGIMSHFVTTACEIAQHVRISDETGTAEKGALFNQENVPADTLFYSVITATKSRVPNGELKDRTPEQALAEFERKISLSNVAQFGADASTGLGFCSLKLNKKAS